MIVKLERKRALYPSVEEVFSRRSNGHAAPLLRIRRDVDDILTASDDELVDGMRFFASRMKLVVEPTGCLGLAAARGMKAELKGKRVGIIVSGGNVDIDRFAALLAG